MNILMLSPLPPPSGGIATWTQHLINYYRHTEDTLRVVNIAMTGDRASKEIMKRKLLEETKRTVRIFSSLRREIKKKRPDVVHINTSCSGVGILRDLLCLKIAKSYHLPVIVQCHCNIKYQLKSDYAKKAFKNLVHSANKVIVLNRYSFEYTESCECGKAVIIPNFIDSESIADSHIIRSTIQKALFVGHIEYAKGVREIYAAARNLPNIQFTLVGPIRQDISELAQPENVLLPGRVSIDKVSEYLMDADIFVLPSKSEGFSIALLEAMAAGLPIIATDVGANSDMIEDKGGVIISTNNENALSKAFREMADSDIRTKMSKWNIDKVRSMYLIDNVMTMFKDVYSDAMNT